MDKKTLNIITGTLIAMAIITARYSWQASTKKFQSYVVAGILWEVGSAMSDSIRQYLVTGDERFLERYKDMGKSRDGTRSWSDIDDYEAIPFMNQYSNLNFRELTAKVGFSDDEMFYFNELENNIDEIEIIENDAINLRNGRYDDEQGTGKALSRRTKQFVEYKGVGKRDAQGAVDLLFSTKYIIAKERAYKSWKEAVKKVIVRTQNHVKFLRGMTTVFTLLAVVAVVYALRQK